MPEQLLSLESPAGQRLIRGSGFVSDYAGLAANFVGQSRRAYCGVASGVGVINAMRGKQGRVDQSTFFTESARKIKTPLQVTFKGMSLKQLGDLLQAHARTRPSSRPSIPISKASAGSHGTTPGDFVLVHYQRADSVRSALRLATPPLLAGPDTDPAVQPTGTRDTCHASAPALSWRPGFPQWMPDQTPRSSDRGAMTFGYSSAKSVLDPFADVNG